MIQKDLNKYILLAAAAFVLALSFWMLLPFAKAILAAGLIALMLRPVYTWLLKRFKRKNLTAFTVMISIFLITVGPLAYLINKFLKEAFVAYFSFRQQVLSGKVFQTQCDTGAICELVKNIGTFVNDSQTQFYIQEFSTKIQSFFLDYGSDIVLSLPQIIISIVIFMIFLFYFLRDGDLILLQLKSIIPLKKQHMTHIIKKTNDTVYAVLYGQFLTAFIQGAIGGVIFYILGLQNPVFWGAMMMLFAIFPIGTWIVWLPASLNLILTGVSWDSNIFIYKGVILFVVGLTVISTIDNILKPMLIGSRSKSHFAMVILGIFGGIKLFGVIGIFAGPLLLAILVGIFDIFREMQHEIQDKKNKN